MWNKVGHHLRELRHLLAGAAIGLVAPFVLVLTLASVPLSLAGGLGLALFVAMVVLTRTMAARGRLRAAAVLAEPVASAYVPVPAGTLARIRTVSGDPATWRDLAWLVAQFVVGLGSVIAAFGLWAAAAQCLFAPLLKQLLPVPTGFDPAVLELTGRSVPLTWLMVAVGAGLAIAAYRLPRYLITGQAQLAHWLLAPTAAARLAGRVEQLAASRSAAVDGSAAELRRIERDLHDGAQVRLIAMTMNLGMAEDVIDADPAGAKALLMEARANAGVALTELRQLVRGIHPPVLADRGLVGAVQALALASSIPVQLDLRLDRRLAASVESAAYFAVAEALANAIGHSGASRVVVAIVDHGAALHISVRDDGRGGANPTQGTGLRGVQRRLSTFDGKLHIASPSGGPTVLDMELPCAS